MILSLESRGEELLETAIIDPDVLRAFSVPRAARRFSDANPNPMAPTHGLRELGPYDVNTSDTRLRRSFDSCEVVCAYPRGDHEIREELQQLVTHLKDGYNESKGDFDIAFEPFAKTFRMANAVFSDKDEFITYDISDTAPFEDEVGRRVEEVRGRSNRPIILVAVRSHKTMATTRDIYNPLKRLLTRRDIPSQFLSDYPAVDTNLGVLYQVGRRRAVGWSVWNVALAIYTKLGGLPWAVTQSDKPGDFVDVTIGLRFAQLSLEKPGFCLGVATVLDRFGRLIGTVPLENMECQKATDMPIPGMSLSTESAQRLVTEALDSVLLDPRTQSIMQTHRPVSIVLHKLGPFHVDEVRGIRGAMAEKLRGRDVRVGFVSIVAGETLAMFGPPSHGRAISEGTGLAITHDTALLYTKASDKRFMTPITVRMRNLGDEDCAFGSVENACAHVQTLCGLHWQTVATGALKLPADLDFAGHIARGFANDIQPKPGSWLWKTQWYL